MLIDAEYNREHNAEKWVRRIEVNFASLKGPGPWRTHELHSLGYSDRNIKTFCQHGLLRKVHQGKYSRV